MAKTKIHGEYLDPSVISGQTQVTAVGADSVLILDATDNALKKALLSDVIETVGSTPTFSQISATSDLTIDVAGDIILDAAGDNWLFNKSGTTLLNIQKDSNNVEFISSISDGDMKFRGNDGGSTITALTLDMSDAGAATFNSSITVANTISISSSNASAFIQASDNVFQFGTSSDDPILFFENNAEVMRLTGGSLGVGTNSPQNVFHVNSGSANNVARFESTDTEARILLKDTTGVAYIAARNDIRFGNDTTTERMRITSAGGIGFGTTSPSSFGGGNFEFSDTSSNQTGLRVTAATKSAEIGVDNTGGYLQTVTDGGGWTFYTSNGGIANTVAMKILADGDVSISNDGQIPHASSKLHIKGSAFTMSDANGNAGGGVQIFNISKSAANTATAVFKVQRDHGAHSGIAIVTKSNSGDSVAKIFAWAACYGSTSADIQTLASNVAGYTDFTASGTVSNDEFTFKLTNGDSNSRSFRVTVIYGGAETLGTPTLY